MVRILGVLTLAERQLAKSLSPEKGRDLIKQVRKQLLELARPMLDSLVHEVAGVKVLSMHHDISTVTGEEVVIFSLAECLTSSKRSQAPMHRLACSPRLLEENMRLCRSVLAAAGHDLRFTIRNEDFILNSRGRREQRMLFADDDAGDEFDAVIMNPPYFKTGAYSAHALAMEHAFQGQTNIYMMFMAKAVELLRPNGEMVAITPRSYCNGLFLRLLTDLHHNS